MMGSCMAAPAQHKLRCSSIFVQLSQQASRWVLLPHSLVAYASMHRQLICCKGATRPHLAAQRCFPGNSP